MSLYYDLSGGLETVVVESDQLGEVACCTWKTDRLVKAGSLDLARVLDLEGGKWKQSAER